MFTALGIRQHASSNIRSISQAGRLPPERDLPGGANGGVH